MNAADAIRLKKKAERCAADLGFAHEKEDIAQDVLLQMLEKPGRPVRYATIDAIRERTGRKGDISYEARQVLNLSVSNGTEHIEWEPESLSGRLEARLEVESLLGSVNGANRAIWLLTYQWGLSEKEIGYLFGVSESRICQRLRRIQARLSQSVLQTPRPEGEAPDDTAEMAREESGEGQTGEPEGFNWGLI